MWKRGWKIAATAIVLLLTCLSLALVVTSFVLCLQSLFEDQLLKAAILAPIAMVSIVTLYLMAKILMQHTDPLPSSLIRRQSEMSLLVNDGLAGRP